MYESLRPGAKQSASVADCIDPRNIILGPYVSSFFLSLFVDGDHPFHRNPHPCLHHPRSFPFNRRPHHRVPLPSGASAAFTSPLLLSPLRIPRKTARISDLASRSLLPFSGGCGGNRPTLLFVVPPTTFSYCDYET